MRAVLALAKDRVLCITLGRVAALLAPARAHVQIPSLGGLRRKLEGAGRQLEDAGRDIERQLRDGSNPAAALREITALIDCRRAF